MLLPIFMFWHLSERNVKAFVKSGFLHFVALQVICIISLYFVLCFPILDEPDIKPAMVKNILLRCILIALSVIVPTILLLVSKKQ